MASHKSKNTAAGMDLQDEVIKDNYYDLIVTGAPVRWTFEEVDYWEEPR